MNVLKCTNNFRKAAEINPEGPAVEAGRMIDQIMVKKGGADEASAKE